MSQADGLYQDTFIAGLEQGLRSVQQSWGLSTNTRWSLLCISENATFRADDPERKNPLVVRVHRPRYHSRDEILSELHWLNALQEARIVTIPTPVTTAEGSFLTGFEHQGEWRDVVAFEFMRGVEPDEHKDIDKWFGKLGEITAQLHLHTHQWPLPRGFTRKIWNFEATLGDIAYWGDWRKAVGLDKESEKLLQRCCDQLQLRLQQVGEGPECFGLIHADLRLANLLVDGDRMSVIDFDDCGFGWYLYDFAAAITFIDSSADISLLQDSWVEGYRRIRPLCNDEVDTIPTFIMLRRILEIAWVASHYETPTARELGGGYTRDVVKMAADYMKNQA